MIASKGQAVIEFYEISAEIKQYLIHDIKTVRDMFGSNILG